jgi:hypothetical protein
MALQLGPNFNVNRSKRSISTVSVGSPGTWHKLQDTSRVENGGGGYLLESLTAERLNLRMLNRIRKDVPSGEFLQRDPECRSNLVKHACYDATGAWF